MIEEWRPIKSWEGYYEVSNAGSVRSLDRIIKGRHGPTRYRGRILRPGWGSGYAVVSLVATGIGRKEQRYIHDLVLETFVGPKPLNQEVCHGESGCRINNLDNLRYDTRSQNALDRHKFGKGWAKRGWKAPQQLSCIVCGKPVWARRRLNAKHICQNITCRQEWGRQCQRLKDTK